MSKTAPKTRNCEYLSDETAKRLIDSLSRIEGHVGAVKRMIDERRCCDEILTQIAAVKSSLHSVTVKLTETELRNCLTPCVPIQADSRLATAMQTL